MVTFFVFFIQFTYYVYYYVSSSQFLMLSFQVVWYQTNSNDCWTIESLFHFILDKFQISVFLQLSLFCLKFNHFNFISKIVFTTGAILVFLFFLFIDLLRFCCLKAFMVLFHIICVPLFQSSLHVVTPTYQKCDCYVLRVIPIRKWNKDLFAKWFYFVFF